VKYVVLLLYHSEEDGEWDGWQAAIRWSVKEVGVIIIDSNDDDDNGGDETNDESSREDGEEDDAALDFSAYDYWRH
jgi:hypothetical protein